MSDAIHIRPASLDDAPAIERFNIEMAMETESLKLDAEVVRDGVRAVLSDPTKGLYFVAQADGEVGGQLMITREWSDWRNGDVWWVQSVYVSPKFRRRGVFRALYRRVEQEAIRAGAAGIRLYVENHNANAQRSYEQLGLRLSNYVLMEKMGLPRA